MRQRQGISTISGASLCLNPAPTVKQSSSWSSLIQPEHKISKAEIKSLTKAVTFWVFNYGIHDLSIHNGDFPVRYLELPPAVFGSQGYPVSNYLRVTGYPLSG